MLNAISREEKEAQESKDSMLTYNQMRNKNAHNQKNPQDSSQFMLPSHFFYLDNKMIEAYYRIGEGENQQEASMFERDENGEILDDDTFLHFSRRLLQELEYLLNLPFVKFWVLIAKDAQVITFLDGFLQNVRKHNDVYKL